MKPRGIWIIIVLILIAGIGTTAYIRDYTKTAYTAEANMPQNLESTAGALADQAENFPDSGKAMVRSIPDKAVAPKDGENTSIAETAAERKAFSAPMPASGSLEEQEMASPETGDGGQASAMARAVPSAYDAAEGETAEGETAEQEADMQPLDVLARLKELDDQIAKNQSRKSGDTANFQKAASETERKLWEAELSRCLDVLETKLDKEEKDALMKEQNEWIRQRENKALEMSGKLNSSVRQELEYNNSMAESTRARVYELAQEYGEILSEAEK